MAISGTIYLHNDSTNGGLFRKLQWFTSHNARQRFVREDSDQMCIFFTLKFIASDLNKMTLIKTTLMIAK